MIVLLFIIAILVIIALSVYLFSKLPIQVIENFKSIFKSDNNKDK